ncbi:ABC transporter substrate-binding protein [Palleronia caenipelagi]|nr:ABC transporter substrate-binding protein [Palleronia caenipelagi]
MFLHQGCCSICIQQMRCVQPGENSMSISRFDLLRRKFLMGASAAALLPKMVHADIHTNRRRLIRSDISSASQLNYLKSIATWNDDFFADIFDPLFRIGADLTFHPLAARSFDVSKDKRTYSVHLNERLWSDGTPITAADYVAAIQHRAWWSREGGDGLKLLDRSILNLQPYIDGKIQAVEEIGIWALDDLTFEIMVSAPNSEFALTFGTHLFFPFAQHSILDPRAEWENPTGLISNGSYVLAEFEKSDSIRVVRNPHSASDNSLYFDEVVYVSSENGANIQSGKVLKGEVDIYRLLDSDLIGWFNDNRPKQLKRYGQPAVSYLNFNLNSPSVADQRIRQALVMALDRTFLSRDVAVSGNTVTNWTNGLNWVWENDPDAGEQANFKYAPEEAVKIMEGLGYDQSNPLRIQLLYRDRANEADIANAISAMWRRIGVELSTASNSTVDHYNKYIIPGNYDIAIVTWVFDTMSLLDSYTMFSTRTSPNEGNYGAAGNSEVDQLLDEAALIYDLPQRIDLFREVELANRDNVWNVPIRHETGYVVISESLRGVEDDAPTRPLSAELWRN